ncbi:hypothetical protein ACFQE8_02895 [Salinirubellus sp. GCM10025818]|jgi:hypothetical protein|uniref:DUF7139 domain-containing protein n=1 Tax=Salinirubellus TaxID=2162630 RepID=UPI0030D142F7
MASLSEVYERDRGGAGLRRLYAGVGLFLVGVVLAVTGVVFGTSTAAADAFGLGVFEAREVAVIAAGVGLPLTFIGVVTVLPQSDRRVRVASAVGSLIALFGVLLFWEFYPMQWYGMETDYTLPVSGIYFLGILTTFWAVFTAVANFKTRNDPGGTVKLEITKQGRTRVVEVSNEGLRSRLSGIGFLGSAPDGETPTQTAGAGESRAPVSDGGSTAAGHDAEFLDEPSPDPRGDVYCGNCAHFNYVRTNDGMKPYCGFNGEVMDDMEPCEEWEANVSGIERIE